MRTLPIFNPIFLWFGILWLVGWAPWAHAHPLDGLIVDQKGSLYFGWVRSLVGPEYVACVWKLDGQGKAHPLFSSQHPARGTQSSNIYISLGLDGRIYCVERQFLGTRQGKDSFVSDLWRLEANGQN